MASQAARFVILLLVFIVIGMLFYIPEYRTLNDNLKPVTSFFYGHSDEGGYVYKQNQTFDVESYGWANEQLVLTGLYRNRGDFRKNVSSADKLILRIAGLSDFINKLKPNIISDHKQVNNGQSGANYFQVSRRVQACNCNAIFRDNQTEILRAKTLERPKQGAYKTNDYIENTKNCSNFIEQRGYITNSLTQEEREFPIAFSILMFTDVEQSERLLRAIYRPQNLYCIHVDNKTDQSTYDAMLGVVGCFDNVFMTSTRFDVQWGTMTVLEPDILCMSELFNRSNKWKYFINLTGQEFPLRTNYELVEILKAYNGSNDVDGTRKRSNPNRWENAGDPPHNITPSKGSLHVVASRGYVDFVLNDQRAKDFLEWCRKVEIPDEVFFTSLQHNPHLRVPGSYTGIPETFSSDATLEKPFVTRFKNWGDGIYNWPCNGKRVRLVCVFGVGDLPLLATRKELFINKIHYNYEPMTYDCMEELHFNHTRDIYIGKLSFNSSWYGNLGFVKNKVV